jgi:tRNA nucleotidyltransferase/poly(A) polymerase
LGATLGFEFSDSLRAHCERMDLSELPGERVWVELDRLLTEPECPGDGLYQLHVLGVVPCILPGLEGVGRRAAATQLNRAAQLGKNLPGQSGLRVLMVSTLLSSLGRAAAIRVLDRLRLFRWEGQPLRRPVLAILEELHRTRPETDTALRRTSERVELEIFLRVWEAIAPGEGALSSLQRAREIGVASQSMPELVRGEDLVAMGLEEGPGLGAELAVVRQAQLSGQVSTREEALSLVRERLKNQPG